MIRKNNAYLLFRLLFLFVFISAIADFRHTAEIDLIPGVHVSDIPALKFIFALLFGLLLIPFKEYASIIKEKYTGSGIILLIVLLIAGYISAYISEYSSVALKVCGRIAFYTIVLLICTAAVRYFESASDFMLKSFIYANVLIITGSLLDFYVPQFHRLLINNFDRPEAIHSYIQIGSEKIMRPMGFITDSNLTAFSLTLSLLLLLLNNGTFSKAFRYIFYLSGSYVLGMLTSRASLIAAAVCLAVFFVFKITERKEIIIFSVLFLLFQSATPQSYGRFISYVSSEKAAEEYAVGRPVIWKAAWEVFKDNPAAGAGPGVFFEMSQTKIREILKENKNINIDNPELPDYHSVDRLNPHSIFLVMLAETGLIGFVIFVSLIALLAYGFYKQQNILSLLFLGVVLFVSALSNFAPYYKYYLIIAVIFFSSSGVNLKITGGRIFKDVERILVFKLCCLGDIVFITVSVNALRRKYPDAEIVFAHTEWVTPLMEYVPGINGKILFGKVYSSSPMIKLKGTLKFISEARKKNFDMVFYGHRSSIFSFILMLCGIRYRLGFKGTWFLTHASEFDKEITEFKRYLNVLSSFGIESEEFYPALKTPRKDTARKKISSGKEPLLGIYPMGGVNPGTNMDIKRWEIENFYSLIKLINETLPAIKVIMFEGIHKHEKLMIPDGLAVLKETISNDLISCCDYFISGDTGSLHIAAAMGVPTLSIFGPSDPNLLAPQNDPSSKVKHITIWKKAECSPCYLPDTAIDKSNKKFWHMNNFLCHTGTHVCMKSITPDEVFEKFQELIKINIKA